MQQRAEAPGRFSIAHLLYAVRLDSARGFERLDPAARPFGVVGQLGFGMRVAADNEVGMERAAGRCAGWLVAEIDRPAHSVRQIRRRTVWRVAVHEDDAALLDRNSLRLDIR